MAYKPVGADENGKFPPRVETAIGATATAAAAAATSTSVKAASEINPDDFRYVVAHDDEEVVWGQYKDGTTYPPTKVEEVGITTEAEGWRVVALYADKEVAWGVRDDGTTYPAATTTTAPGTSTPATNPLDTAGVLMLGHSIIENYWDSTAALATRLGRAVTISALGGRASIDVAARYGAIPAAVTVTGNTIPASGTVAATVTPTFLRAPSDGSRSMTGQLAGVTVTINAVTVGAATTYTVERVSAGTAVPCTPGTPFVPVRPESLLILAAMRNDIPAITAATLTVEQSIANQRAILDLAPWREHALVLGVLPTATETIGARAVYDAAAAAQKAAFGRQWVDWLGWLQSDAAFTAAALTKTAQDNTDIANGVIPTSLRFDTLHLNAAGETATSALIENHYKARGLNR